MFLMPPMYCHIQIMIKRLLGSIVYRSTLVILVGRVCGIAIAFLSTAFLARVLGTEGLGIFSYSVVVVSLLGIFLNAGMPMLITRELSRNSRNENYSAMSGLVKWSFYLLIAFSSIALAIVYCYLFLFKSGLDSIVYYEVWVVSFLILPFAAIMHRGRGILLGLNNPVAANLTEQLVRPGIALVLYAMVSIFVEMDPLVTIIIFILAYLLTSIFVTWQVRKSIPPKVRHAKSVLYTKKWLLALVPLTGLAGLSIVKHQTDIIMLGAMTSYSDAGVYRVASQIAAIPAMLMVVLNSVFSPKIAGSTRIGEDSALLLQLIFSARAMFLFAVMFLVVFLIFGKYLVVMVFGVEFENAFMYCLILSLGVIFSAWCGQTATILKMTDNAGIAFRVSIESALLNVILNYVLIILYGPVGAALATAISVFWVQVRQLAAVKRELGLTTHAFSSSAG